MEPKIIALQHLLEKGIHYEKASEITKSIYRDVYRGAFEAVEQIRVDNQNREGKGYRNLKGRNVEIANVISFVGRRGTGKSSSMMSFQGMLQNYSERQTDKENFDSLKGASFFVLDCIDASTLEESESVFTIVLANILSMIEEYGKEKEYDLEEYQRRSLRKKLEDLYENYSLLTDPNASGKGEYSSYENLKSLASSQKIRTQFERLVIECLQYFNGHNKHSSKEMYLVITIDDLDMAHYNKRVARQGQLNIRSYEIMRLLSKYFSIPGVIVLTAYNHTDLYQQCSSFFAGSNASNYHDEYEIGEDLKSGSRLATEFMEKVFLPMYRFYMPSWKKWDYNRRAIQIDVDKYSLQEDIFTRFLQSENPKHIFTIKELLLILYAEMLGIYYDCEGKKKHFLEPGSLRELSNTLYLFVDEESREGSQELHLAKKDKNEGNVFKRVMDDAYFRYASEHIYLEKERVLFNDLLEYQPQRRGEKIVQLISPMVKPLGRTNRQIVKLLKQERQEHGQYTSQRLYSRGDLEEAISFWEDNSDVSYSYAELIHSIYHMTRSEKPYSKELVACILHSYSIALSQLYDSFNNAKKKLAQIEENGKDIYIKGYRKLLKEKQEVERGDNIENNAEGKDEEKIRIKEIEGYAQPLKEVIGNTVFGKWTEYYFPKVYTKHIKDDYAVIIGCFENMREAAFKVNFLLAGASTDENIEDIIKGCIFLMMMHSDILQWKQLEVEITRKSGKEEVGELNIWNSEEIKFELTAFINVSIFYPEYLYKMEQLLLDSFVEKRKDQDVEKEFKAKLRETTEKIFKGLWEKYYEWDKVYGNMILPVHNFDLMYNLIKHLFKEGKEINERTLDISDKNAFMEEFQLMILRIEKHLEEIDHFYYLQNENSFLEKFKKCPFFTLLEEVKSKKICMQSIDTHMKGVAMGVYNHRMLYFAADSMEGTDEVI